MPWCAECARFLSPSTVRPDGACPVCGRAVEPGRARPPAAPTPGRRRNRLAHRRVEGASGMPFPAGDEETDPGSDGKTDPGSDGKIGVAGAPHSFPSVRDGDSPPGGSASGGGDGSDADPDDEELPAVPWHLKALAGGLVVYLGYRFMQGLEWVWHRIG